MSDIKQKINNGEGMVFLKNRGWVTAIEYDQKTDKNINKKDWQDWQEDEIIYKPNTKDYELKNNKIELKKEIEQKFKKE